MVFGSLTNLKNSFIKSMDFGTIAKLLAFIYSNTQSSSLLNITIMIFLITCLYQGYYFIKSLQTIPTLANKLQMLRESNPDIKKRKRFSNGKRSIPREMFISKLKDSPNFVKF
jgi:hypothetical protein